MIVIRPQESCSIRSRNAIGDDIVGGLDVERFLDFGERGEGEMEENGAYEKAGQGAVFVMLVHLQSPCVWAYAYQWKTSSRSIDPR